MSTRTTISTALTFSKITLLAALPVCALLLTAPAAHAGPVGYASYTTLSSFIAAAPNTTTYGFEGIASSFGNTTDPSSTFIAPFTLTDSDGSPAMIWDSASQGGNMSLNGTDSLTGVSTQYNNPSSLTTTIRFGGSYTAFATEFGFRNGSSTAPSGTISVQLFNGTTAIGGAYNSSVPAAGTFFGLVSAQAFDRATFTATQLSGTSNAYQTFDNMRIGPNASAAAPEPGSIALLLTAGVPVVGLVRRRKGAKTSTAQKCRRKH